MAEDGVRHKVVDNVDDCVKAVDDLLQQPVVAVDCEGINLGKTGPLTLLQVAKLDGFVYLFNVFVEPKVFSEGRLKTFLENRDIVKVFHACNRDSAALKCQFDVMLNNVFDVQTAVIIIEKSEGRQLPCARKLIDVCSRYVDVTSLERKEDVTAKLYKRNAAYWATKELTPEMIDYACADVRVLIPEVYEKLKSTIDDKDLWGSFRERVDYELNFRWNEAVKSESDEVMSHAKKVLRQFESKYSSHIAFAAISDEDDIQALKLVRITEINEFPVLVRRLKIEFLQKELKTIEEEMTSQGDSFIATMAHFSMLYAAKRSNNSELKNTAQRQQQRANDITQERHGRQIHGANSKQPYQRRRKKVATRSPCFNRNKLSCQPRPPPSLQRCH